MQTKVVPNQVTATVRILAKVSLLLCAVLLITSIAQLAVPGKRWPSYALAAAFTILPLAVGHRWLRFAGVVGFVLCGTLVIGDLQAGKAYRERVNQIIQNHQASQ